MGNHLGSTWPSITLLFLTGDLVTWTTWTSIYLSHKLLLLTTPWNWIIIFEVYRTIRGKLSSRVHFPPVKTLLESWMSESILLEFCIFCVYSLISEDWKSVIETALAFRSARMIVPGVVPPPWQVVDNFCHNFDLNQARCAPERRMFLNFAPETFVFWKNQSDCFWQVLAAFGLAL